MIDRWFFGNTKKTVKKVKLIFIICVIGLFLTILPFSHILIFHDIRKIILGNAGDSYQFIWIIYHSRLFLEGRESLFYTYNQFYPKGRSFYFFTLSPALTLPASAISFIIENYNLLYNILLLSTFFFSFVIMFFLSYSITRDKIFSTLISSFFSYLPFHFSHALGHLNLSSIFIFPLMFWFINRWVSGKITNLEKLMFLLICIFSFFVDQQLYLWAAIGNFIFLVLRICFSKMTWSNRLKNIVECTLLLLIPLLIFLSMVLSSPMEIYEASKQIPESYVYLYDYFIIPYYNLPRNISGLLLNNRIYSGDESNVSLTPFFFIALLFAILWRKKIKFRNSYHDRRWIPSAATSIILMLISSHEIFFGLSLNSFFASLPYLNSIKVISRAAISVNFFFIITLVFLYPNIPVNRRKFINLLLLLSTFSSVPFLSYKFPYHTALSTSDKYIVAEIRQMKNCSSVLTIPLDCVSPYSAYLSIYHSKKLVNGFMPRVPPSSFSYLRKLESALEKNETTEVTKLVKEIRLCAILVERDLIYDKTCNRNGKDLVFLRLNITKYSIHKPFVYRTW